MTVEPVDQDKALRAALVEARTTNLLSQRRLAARLGKAHSYIAKIEVGDRHIAVSDFVRIARAIGVDPVGLLAKILSESQANDEIAPNEGANE